MDNYEGLCRAIREEGLLISLLNRELPSTEEHRVLTHLRTCKDCLGLAADLLYTDTRLKEMFDQQDETKVVKERKVTRKFLLEVDKLPLGKTLDQDLMDEEDQLLVGAGTVLTRSLIDTLKRRGIQKLTIRSSEIEEEIEVAAVDIPSVSVKDLTRFVTETGVEPAISEYTRQQCLLSIKQTFENLEEVGTFSVEQVQESANMVAEEVLSRPQFSLTLGDMILMDPSLHSHSVNVLILFLLSARAMGHPAQLIRDHAPAALLHDIGRVVLRRTAASGEGDPVTSDEEDREHTEIGYAYLWNLGGFCQTALKMLMNHHERFDGEGYPRGLKGTNLSDWDQLLILANTFDCMTWNRKSGLRTGFHEALSALIQNGGRFVRKGIIRAVIQTFGHYPPGSWVRLNSGEVGLVTKAHPGSPLKPIIAVVYDANGRKLGRSKTLDLGHTQSAYIQGPVSVNTTI